MSSNPRYHEVPLLEHPLRNHFTDLLSNNIALKILNKEELQTLQSMLSVITVEADVVLQAQGSHDMSQFFVLDGFLKRVVTSRQGRDMTVHISKKNEFETYYSVCDFKSKAPYSILSIKHCTVAKCSLVNWKSYLNSHLSFKIIFK